jgi:hypothetical protein
MYMCAGWKLTPKIRAYEPHHVLQRPRDLVPLARRPFEPGKVEISQLDAAGAQHDVIGTVLVCQESRKKKKNKYYMHMQGQAVRPASDRVSEHERTHSKKRTKNEFKHAVQPMICA